MSRRLRAGAGTDARIINHGQPFLISETRQRLTGLGAPHSDPTLGFLVAETLQLQPSLESELQKGAAAAKTEAENSKLKTDQLVTRSVTYRHRDSGLVTVVATDPNGRITEQRSQGGLLASVVDRDGAEGKLPIRINLSTQPIYF